MRLVSRPTEYLNLNMYVLVVSLLDDLLDLDEDSVELCLWVELLCLSFPGWAGDNVGELTGCLEGCEG